MSKLINLRVFIVGLAGCILACAPAHALVSLNDGTDHVYVTATASVAYDSNIFAHAGVDGDYVYSASLLFEYARRSGLIDVKGSVAVNASSYAENSGENFADPKFTLVFTKDSGHTTGSLTLGAARENRADSAANVRAVSWNYDAGLTLKYPVIERYSISGSMAYNARLFEPTLLLSDLRTFTVGADLAYALTSDRDFVAGYQYRRSETSANSAFDDQSFTMGVSGRIFSRVSGSLRAGYQDRSPRTATSDGKFQGLTASGTVVWTVNNRMSFTGQLSKDVSITSTDVSVDTTGASIESLYTVNKKLSLVTSLGAGKIRFLGVRSTGRHDEYFTFGPGLNYTLDEHLRISLAYAYFKNTSTYSYSEFTRNSVTLTLTSRW